MSARETHPKKSKSPAIISPDSTPLLLDPEQASALVGVRPGVFRRWVSEGLPFVRAGRGGKKMYAPVDLVRFVERLKETAGER
jgi:hypothetical protein